MNRLPQGDHLWYNKNKLWIHKYLIKILTQKTIIRLRVCLIIQNYRNIAIEMGCEYIDTKFIRDLLTTKDIPHKNTDVIINTIDLAAVYEKDIAKQYEVRDNIIRNLNNKSIRIFKAIDS